MAHSDYRLVVFDLDGTLIQSHNTIFESMRFSFRELGITKEPDKNIFMGMIGHHFNEIFDALGIEVSDFDEFLTIYKSMYFNFIDSSSFYPGVLETIEWLNKRGIKIALLTTKAQDQAELIIDHFGLNKYFDEVTGRRPGVANKPDAEPLLNILRKLNADPKETVMVGDSELDIKCGKNAGTSTCAVTFGYRDLKDLQSENPDYIIDEMKELQQILNHTV